MQKLLDFLNELRRRKIHYSLECNRKEAIMVMIAVPGERWEVEFFADDRVEVEIFTSSGEIEGEKSLAALWEKFSD